MRVQRLGRGGLAAVLVLFAAAICLVGCIAGTRGVRVDFSATYYFVVRDCESAAAEAVAGQVHSAGGAGYLMDDTVVIACYYTERDAERAKSSLGEKKVGARIEKRESGRVYAKNAEEAKAVLADLDAADACARILFSAANSLERAQIGQSAARAALEQVKLTLRGLREENAEFLRWNAALHEIEREAEELKGLIFARDLRLLQVRLCELTAKAGKYF